ncbi:hypothetical protein EJB05_01906 [Eragrostis curvula]|uniref:Uncharacterized protein n=1 Tax=Eragrostis curvula TaxID=38414 RepID=A0A5J9WQY4_9POAL|nr:hypothetical protein EJB05_01906 [Eragrostis curvula]
MVDGAILLPLPLLLPPSPPAAPTLAAMSAASAVAVGRLSSSPRDPGLSAACAQDKLVPLPYWVRSGGRSGDQQPPGLDGADGALSAWPLLTSRQGRRRRLAARSGTDCRLGFAFIFSVDCWLEIAELENSDDFSIDVGSSDSRVGEIDIPAILSSLKEDLRDVDPLSSLAQKLRLPKVELGLSNFDSEVLLRSLIAHQVKSITLTQACARQSLPSEDEISKKSSLEVSLAKADEALRVSSTAVSRLEHETASLRSIESGHKEYISLVEKTIRRKKLLLDKEELFRKLLSSRLSDLAESRVKLLDVGYVASLHFCGLLKELLDAVGAGYDNLSEDASPDDVGEWLRVNLKGLMGVCRDHSYDAVILMIRDLLHSSLCHGSDAIEVITQPSFSAKVSDPGNSYGAIEARCLSLINEFWWKRVKTVVPDLPEGPS